MFCFVNFREHGIFITVIRYFYFLMSVNRAYEFPPPPPLYPPQKLAQPENHHTEFGLIMTKTQIVKLFTHFRKLAHLVYYHAFLFCVKSGCLFYLAL